MKRRQLLLLGSIAAAAACMPVRADTPLPQIDVYRSPTCGCCGAWVDHLKAAGFPVNVIEVGDTSAVRKRFGLPDRFGSCHTGIVSGYVVEGHVPAADVKRLLATRPKAIGIAVPGMPVGSPGMEAANRSEAYDVLLVDKMGRSTVFTHHPRTSRSQA